MKKLQQVYRRLAVMVLTVVIGLTGAFPGVALAATTVTYPQDTSLELTGVPVTLTILAGSAHGDSLTINASNFVLPAEIDVGFTVRYTGPSAKRFNDGTSTYCTYTAGNNDFVFTSAHIGKTISIDASNCVPPSGGGGGPAYTAPYVSLVWPNGGGTLTAGGSAQISWSAGGSGVSGIRMKLSTDSGVTYPTTIVSSTYNSSLYYWTVPDVSTTKARIKIEVINSSGSTLASDSSNADFSIDGTEPPDTTTPETKPPDTKTTAPAPDSNSSGTYNPQSAINNTPTINLDLNIPEVAEEDILDPENPDKYLCPVGKLIKGAAQATVYYCGSDYRRYVFPNQKIFLTWFSDFSSLVNITDGQLAQVMIGGNVTYKPGVRMVKITTDPKVYAIARGGLLRWVTSEAVATALYGSDWNQKIDDVPDSFFFNYTIGDPITDADVGL